MKCDNCGGDCGDFPHYAAGWVRCCKCAGSLGALSAHTIALEDSKPCGGDEHEARVLLPGSSLEETIRHFGSITGLVPPVIADDEDTIVPRAIDRINDLAQQDLRQRFPWASEIHLAVVIRDAIDEAVRPYKQELETCHDSCEEHIRARNEQAEEISRLTGTKIIKAGAADAEE